MKQTHRLEQELVLRIDSQIRELQLALRRAGVTLPGVPEALNTAAINNLLDNGDFNWSQDAYLNVGITPGTAGDLNNRAYNWYRIQRATALLVEDDAHGLKGPAHSLFGGESADTPRWSKTDGWAELGETGGTAWDICCPLPNNFVTPGMRFRLQMLARLGTATPLPGPLRFFWYLQDNTNSAPAPIIIRGSAFTLDGVTYGPLGATTRTYKLIVDTDYGNQVESTVKVVNNAPAVLSPSNGVALSWPRYPGFTRVSIYVTVGGASFLVGIIGNGANAFNDVGQTLGPVAAVPTITDTQAEAYAEARNFLPTEEWALWKFSIIAPQTYDASLTTGKQWLRGGVIGLMGDPRQLQVDRIGLSTGDGVWSLSDHDKSAKSLPSTAQVGSTQGPPAGGGPPPGDGEGERFPSCSTLETLIDICDEDGGSERKVALGDIDEAAVKKGTFVVSGNEIPSRVTNCRIGFTEMVITIETENGARRRCSPSDLWIEHVGPLSGTAARRLCEGMAVLTRINGSIQPSKIVRYSTSIQGEEVRILSTDGERDSDHIYWAGSAGAHNVKLLN